MSIMSSRHIQVPISRSGDDNVRSNVYIGTTHGFAIRPNLKYNESKEGFEGAFSQAVSWFQKTIF